jgi:hypothetical protein
VAELGEVQKGGDDLKMKDAKNADDGGDEPGIGKRHARGKGGGGRVKRVKRDTLNPQGAVFQKKNGTTRAVRHFSQ